MTSKSKNAVRTVEIDIEKSREESNWKKALELAQQLKARSPQYESLACFLIGEGKLEAHLEEWPPTRDNIERAQRELSEARGYLTLATDEAGKKAGVALDAHLLLGKLNYAGGSYEEALKHFNLAELSTLTEKDLPVRSLRIVAESYAIRGLCLEETSVPSSGSKYKQAEREADTIRSYEISSELTLLYLQRGAARAGPTLEAALRRAPALHFRAGRPDKALQRYRAMLSAVECGCTQALRLTLALRLAEVLARGLARKVYTPPEGAPPPAHGTLSRRRDDHASDGPWKPKKYAAINQFVPQNEYEETLLLLLVGEAMAARDAVLSQSAEFEAARQQSLAGAAAVADLLAVIAARWQRLCLLRESLERAMKFSFGCRHVWRQRALATAAELRARRADHAYRADRPARGSAAWRGGVTADAVVKRAAKLCPKDVALRLVAAQTRFKMGWIEEGLEMAEEALAIEQEENGPLLGRCYLFCGIGYQMKAEKTNSRPGKLAAYESGLNMLEKSVSFDNNDYLAFYHLALQYVHLGRLDDAMDATRSCLSSRAECAGGLRLVLRLWAAGPPAPPPPPPAPELLALPFTYAYSTEEALAAGKELLAALYSAEAETAWAALEDASLDPDIASDKDATSVRAESSRARSEYGAKTERALSESLSCMSVRSGRSPLAEQRSRAWLYLAEICLRMGRTTAAAGCVAEAAALTPTSHHVLYTRGLVAASRGEWETARQCFQNAVAVHPTHLDSLLQLGTSYYELGWLRLAEKVLRSACALSPSRADCWRRLALVLAALGQHEAAADAGAAALLLLPNAKAAELSDACADY